MAPQQTIKSPERHLEEGNIHSIDHAGNGVPPHAHKKHWYRRQKQQKHKEKVEAKLPGVMQGAKDAQDAERRLKLKNEVVAGVGEFCGTFLFLFMSFGIATIAGQQANTASSAGQVQGSGAGSTGSSIDPSQLMYSSLGFGFSLAVNAWLFFRVSGGLFNPAVTLALFMTGFLSWYRSILLFFIQFIAGIAAAGMAQVLIPGGINCQTKIAGSTSVAQGFFIEMFMTAQLVFAVFMLAGEKHRGTFMAPVGIGLALFIAELWATPFTGGSLNPARTLGPDVIAGKWQGSTWIYYTAPFVGTLLAALVYKILKYAQYETAVEGQDDDAMKLIMRDDKGRVTGMVDQVAADDQPEELAKVQRGSPAPSIITVNGEETAVEAPGAEQRAEHKAEKAGHGLNIDGERAEA